MTILLPLMFLAGSPGPLELLVIFAVILVLFGPRKLPEIARMLGRALHELRRASEDFKSQIMSLDEPSVPTAHIPPAVEDATADAGCNNPPPVVDTLAEAGDVAEGDADHDVSR